MNHDFMSRGCNIPYSSADNNPSANALWILGQMGACASVNCDDSERDDSDSSDGSDSSLVEYIFRRLPGNSWRMKLKYVRQKSGAVCGSGKRFVPVSCSKNCPTCDGSSPGCGRNYEFDEINDFFLRPETWRSLRNQFDENPELNYIVISYPVQ